MTYLSEVIVVRVLFANLAHELGHHLISSGYEWNYIYWITDSAGGRCKKKQTCYKQWQEPLEIRTYPLVNIQKAMENHHLIIGKTLLWHFLIAIWNSQGVIISYWQLVLNLLYCVLYLRELTLHLKSCTCLLYDHLIYIYNHIHTYIYIYTYT